MREVGIHEMKDGNYSHLLYRQGKVVFVHEGEVPAFGVELAEEIGHFLVSGASGQNK
ncbi:hypothetical protein D3C86_1337280 [compost metagenome]